MKVIEVTKMFRNGKETKLIYIPDEYCTDEADPVDGDNLWEHEFASRWAEEESSGHRYGYDFEWKVVSDPRKIDRCIQNEINDAKNVIERKTKLMEELTFNRLIVLSQKSISNFKQ